MNRILTLAPRSFEVWAWPPVYFSWRALVQAPFHRIAWLRSPSTLTGCPPSGEAMRSRNPVMTLTT